MALNPAWKKDQEEAISWLSLGYETKPYSYTTGNAEAKKFLVLLMCKYKLNYVIKNMGAGISIITTETDCCPFCKGKQNEK